MSWFKTSLRLLSNPLMSRRLSPLVLIIWVITAIILFYKLTNYDTPSYITTIGPSSGNKDDYYDITRPEKLETNDNNKNDYYQNNHIIGDGQESIQDSESNGSSNKDVINGVKNINGSRWNVADHIRDGKVFILLIEDEKLVKYQSNIRNQAKDRRRHLIPDLDSDLPNHDWDISLPEHIELVIEILESHRISYTLGSTRNGLPSSLLADTKDSASGRKGIQYSVIIMDDFMKYTKLNRWLRDQIDRHCRKNNIGIVTYLTETPILSDNGNNNKIPSFTADPRPARQATSSSSRSDKSDISNDVITTSHSADQFPLSFKSIHQNSCKSSLASRSCLRDYSLNDKSTILRILKRRPNFVLRGPLVRNLNRSPWISISTNHVTYEPLTWATLVRANNTQSENNNNNDNNAHQSHQNNVFRMRHKRAAITNSNQGFSNASGLDSSSSSDTPNLDLKPVQSARETNVEDVMPPNGDEPSTGADSIETGENFNNDHDIDNHDEANNIDDLLVDKQARGGGGGDDDFDTNNVAANNLSDNEDRQVLSLYDRGLFDGIKRVIFGGANHHWLNRILLLDSIEHLSNGRILSPLDRFVQIDIDDVFVGEKGTKLTSGDVDALLGAQASFSQRFLANFKFNLGYSGAFYERGLEEERHGDRRLVQSAANFTWFCHTWSHKKAHLFNETQSLELELSQNLEFARKHQLPTLQLIGIAPTDKRVSQRREEPIASSYAIAPHHSGVYPIHEQLYDAWRRILNVQVTSTEEYPHLRPANARRAFVHKNIKVLPRQTCGLYTHTILRSKYPGGFRRLVHNIEGGELFQTVLHNPVNIYMTHQSNYAHDRLALLTFERLFRFIQLHTNLQLRFEPENRQQGKPGAFALANYYFSLYPSEQQEPIWTDPCSDSRHLAIWAPQKHSLCRYAPKLLIVGPQKSGTTALLEFLQMSPQIKTSLNSPSDFEEIQFFNEKHYWRGVDWYLRRFETDPQKDTKKLKSGEEQDYLFVDKSATYFDDPKAPQRAHALLPDSKIIIMLINPADRAYSWYQHQRAHSDPVATQYSFEQVIKSDEPSDSQNDNGHLDVKLKALRSRCLMPGFYSSHLSRWLDYYSSRQIIIIDGQWFRTNPAAVLNKLQAILRVEKQIDYRKMLYYEPRKGFYCQRAHRRSHCLGSGKGRRYEPMSADARLYLNRLYYGHNRQLARILIDIGQPLPAWLLEATSTSSISYNYLK